MSLVICVAVCSCVEKKETRLLSPKLSSAKPACNVLGNFRDRKERHVKQHVSTRQRNVIERF